MRTSIKAINSRKYLITNGQTKIYSFGHWCFIASDGVVCLAKYAENPNDCTLISLKSCGIKILRNITISHRGGIFRRKITLESMYFSDGFDIFNFRYQFKQSLPVYLEVLDKSHRAIVNFLSLSKVAIRDNTFSSVK